MKNALLNFFSSIVDLNVEALGSLSSRHTRRFYTLVAANFDRQRKLPANFVAACCGTIGDFSGDFLTIRSQGILGNREIRLVE